jgi:FMN reductase (NADPH)
MPKDDAGTVLTSETIELLHNRVSIRKYSDEPVSEAHVEALLGAAFRAPTSSNIQSYSVVVVRDKAVLAELYPVVGNQAHVRDAPVFLCFCADITRMEHAIAERGGSMDDNPLEIGLVASIDASLLGMSAYLTAESLGLRGLMIGAVRNNPTKVAEILNLPKRVYAVFGMVLGWPAEAPQQKPRMDYSMTVHHDQYGNQKDDRGLADQLGTYDEQLSSHYTSIGKETTPDSWTNDIHSKFAEPRRTELRDQLKERGFDFL